jgi:hypothetical protein
MQRAVNATIEEEMFSMSFIYIHCWATNMFSEGPSLNYISGTEPNQMRTENEREREREWSESSAVKGEDFGIFYFFISQFIIRNLQNRQ